MDINLPLEIICEIAAYLDIDTKRHLESAIKKMHGVLLPDYLFISDYKRMFDQSISELGNISYITRCTDISYRYTLNPVSRIYNGCAVNVFIDNTLIVSRSGGYDRSIVDKIDTVRSDGFPRRVNIRWYKNTNSKKNQYFKIMENLIVN